MMLVITVLLQLTVVSLWVAMGTKQVNYASSNQLRLALYVANVEMQPVNASC